jgi:hypothetical protein
MSGALGVQHALRASSTYVTETKSKMWRYGQLKNLTGHEVMAEKGFDWPFFQPTN